MKLMTPTQARVRAGKILLQVADGGDPQDKQVEKRAGLTVGAVLQQYVDEYSAAEHRDNTAKQCRRLLLNGARSAIGFGPSLIPMVGYWSYRKTKDSAAC